MQITQESFVVLCHVTSLIDYTESKQISRRVTLMGDKAINPKTMIGLDINVNYTGTPYDSVICNTSNEAHWNVQISRCITVITPKSVNLKIPHFFNVMEFH